MTRAGGGEQPLLFARDFAIVGPLPASDRVCVGIDVGGMAKGFHAVALVPGGGTQTYRSQQPDAVVAWCLALGAAAVAVDAPCRWSASGRSRTAERALYAEGIHAYATPTLAVASVKPFYGWMLNGAALYARLAHHYVAFGGGDAPPRIYLETYPQAIACALAARIVKARNKRADRRALLFQAGVDTDALTNIDYLDAGLCAVAAAYARAGRYRAYGDGSEGLIVVPGAKTTTRPAT